MEDRNVSWKVTAYASCKVAILQCARPRFVRQEPARDGLRTQYTTIDSLRTEFRITPEFFTVSDHYDTKGVDWKKLLGIFKGQVILLLAERMVIPFGS